MTYEEFFRQADQRNVRIVVDDTCEDSQNSLSNEALFQLPLLAMVILTISKGKSKPVLSEIGQLVGECLERTVSGFKGSSQDIGWSANLRIRTVKALTFLEMSGLATVDERTKLISTTDRGRIVFNQAISAEGRLSNALFTVERSYQNIRAESKIREEV